MKKKKEADDIPRNYHGCRLRRWFSASSKYICKNGISVASSGTGRQRHWSQRKNRIKKLVLSKMEQFLKISRPFHRQKQEYLIFWKWFQYTCRKGMYFCLEKKKLQWSYTMMIHVSLNTSWKQQLTTVPTRLQISEIIKVRTPTWKIGINTEWENQEKARELMKRLNRLPRYIYIYILKCCIRS